MSCPRATAALCCRRRTTTRGAGSPARRATRSLSVRQTEALARGTAAERPARRRKARLHSADAIEAAREAEEELATALGTRGARASAAAAAARSRSPSRSSPKYARLARRIGRDQAA